MKRLLAAAMLAGGMAGAAAATGPIGAGAVPLDGWNRAASAPPVVAADARQHGAAAPAVPAPDAPPPAAAAPQATAGTAEDAALGLHVIPDLRPSASPWALLAVAVLALGYVLVKRPR